MIKEMTATAVLGIGSLISSGYSESARFIYNMKMESISELQKPEFYFSVLKQVLPELKEIAIETQDTGWDGYSAQPIVTDTLTYACAFLGLLPNMSHTPSIGVEPDGHITIEWYKSPYRTFSISVSPSGELHYAALFGPNKTYGTEIFYDEIPKNILELIDRVYFV
jgi:hypothetical protein